MAANWSIKITDFLGGFAPAHWKSTYPSYGNKNMAGSMQNIDILNPSYLTQGPDLSVLTNGDEGGNVSTLITSILDKAESSGTTYAVGGDQVYTLSGSAVTSAHTITGTNVVAEDVIEYQGNIYYSYNCSAGGDIGKYDGTWDDTWYSTKTGGNMGDHPHPMESGGSDRLYIANGNYVVEYNGDTDTVSSAALDLPEGNEMVSMLWNNSRLWMGANRPNISGDNKAIATIYIWNTATDSWNDSIPWRGKIGGLRALEGVTYAFYRDVGSDADYQLGYVDGSSIREVTGFTGGLPDQYQITEYNNVIIWTAGQKIYAWGAVDSNQLSAAHSQLASATFSNTGALACPFGTPFIASSDGSSNYELSKFSGYTTSSNWESLQFNVADVGTTAVIDKLIVDTEALGSGAQCDVSLLDNSGNSLWSQSFTSGQRHEFAPKTTKPNQIIKLDFSNGSTSNPVKVKSIRIKGHTNG